MDLLITLIIYAGIFCLAAFGAKWIITSYSLPQPFLWIVGVALLIVLIIFLASLVGGKFPTLHLVG